MIWKERVYDRVWQVWVTRYRFPRIAWALSEIRFRLYYAKIRTCEIMRRLQA